MKKTTFPLLLLIAIAAGCFYSCTKMDKGDAPPVSIPAPQDCQITKFFFYGAMQKGIGLPELVNAPMQGWNIGVNVYTFTSQHNPDTATGEATATWEWLTFAYNAAGSIKEIVQHGYRAPGFCPVAPACEQAYLFDYDNNGNPVTITGDQRDFNGHSLGTYPVANNTFDLNGRLLQQDYPNGSYWRFEYKSGNLYRMFFKDPKQGAEQLKYLFLAYDNNTNWAKTNPLWRIYFNTYSENNPTSFHQFTGKKIQLPTDGSFDEFIDVQVVYKYGSKNGKLPTYIDFRDPGTGNPFADYPVTIDYQCTPIKVVGE